MSDYFIFKLLNLYHYYSLGRAGETTLLQHRVECVAKELIGNSLVRKEQKK